MNIFLHELKSYRKTTIIWTVSVAVVFVAYMSIFPSFKEGAEAFKQVLAGFSPEFLRAFGVPEDLFTILNFYSYVFVYITLCGAIQAMNLGLSIISKEIRNKTADFLITKPVSRFKIITSKILASFSLLAFTNIIFITIAFITAKTTGETFDTSIFLKISFSLTFIQLVFFSLGFLIAVCVKKIKNVLPVSMGIVFGLFMLGMVSGIAGSDEMRYLVPFKYLDTGYLIANGKYETQFLILGLFISIAFIVASYIVYSRKDIKAV